MGWETLYKSYNTAQLLRNCHSGAFVARTASRSQCQGRPTRATSARGRRLTFPSTAATTRTSGRTRWSSLSSATACSEADRRTILLKKLPTTVHSPLVSNLRKVPTYIEMKAELESEIVFLQDYGPGGVHRAGHISRPRSQSLLVTFRVARVSKHGARRQQTLPGRHS